MLPVRFVPVAAGAAFVLLVGRPAIAATHLKPPASTPATSKPPTATPSEEDLSEVRRILRNADFLAACEDGNATKVQGMLKDGADPNAARPTGANALSYAVAGRHTEVVRLLLDARADPNRTSAGLSPLFLAAELGDFETVKLLIRSGANVNAKLHAVDEDLKAREGDTALIAAASPNGTASTVKALLAAGADVNAKAENGKTAVMQAVASENIGVLRALLEAKPDLRARMTDEESDFDALTLAVGKSKAEMVEALIDAGADPTVRMDDEVTLLEFAILSDQPVVATRLRKAGLAEPSPQRLAELRKAATQQ
jgi:ankyrin repeat protein